MKIKVIYLARLSEDIGKKEEYIDLINPKKNVGIKNWNIVNDDVMGGISSSNLIELDK